MPDETVLVYAGKGSSHSWVWLADLFEERGALNTKFTDAEGLERELRSAPSVVVVSGGDGFEIASSLAGKPFAALREYVEGGGRYVGLCAGAYIPLPSRMEPFSELNLSATRIRNIAADNVRCADRSPRMSVQYGSCSIFHPVRGEIVVDDGRQSLTAPIYGGPVFCEPKADEVLLRYRAFTDSTTFQVDRANAEYVMIGRPAVIRSRCGDGELILAGPHLEHPGYKQANDYFMRAAGLTDGRLPGRRLPERSTEAGDDLRRSLADLKVAVLGMEHESFILGRKQWDGSRMLELARAIEKRARSLEADTAKAVSLMLDRSRESLLSAGPEGVTDSDSAPTMLVEAARVTVDGHFSTLRDEFILGDSH